MRAFHIATEQSPDRLPSVISQARPKLRLIDFAGRWSITRTIDDAFSQSKVEFAGECIFEPKDGVLDYLETGTLHLESGAEFLATRKYLWRQGDGVIEVSFEDGRLFHKIDCAQVASMDIHICGDDTYQVAYDFALWPNWTAVWNVKGPRKDYRMSSDHVRLDRPK